MTNEEGAYNDEADVAIQRLLPLPVIARALRDMRLHYISREIDLSYPILHKMREGETNLSYRSIALVSRYLIDTFGEIGAGNVA